MTYDEFWLRYLRAHAKRETRLLHFCGSGLALACLARGIARRDWRWILAAPAVGYGMAWGAHYGVEGNRPETFGHPLWSLVSDLRMAGLALQGRLGRQVERAQRG